MLQQLSWFKVPPEDPNSPRNKEIYEFYKRIRISREQAAVIPPDRDEIKEGFDTDLSLDGTIPLIMPEEEPRGRPSQKNREIKIRQTRKRIPLTPRLRQDVYTRCKYICEYCDNHNNFIQVHHKDGDPTNNDTSNLMGVCPNCHKKLDSLIREKRRGTEL